MTTSVMTLREYADLLDDLAADWDGDQPAVLIGDVVGDISVDAEAVEGCTKHGTVAYAGEVFDGNGVLELGQRADRRFYGTMLLSASELNAEVRERALGESTSESGGGRA